MSAPEVELLARLVAMPTITDDVEANAMAVAFIEQYLAERGMHTRQFRFDGHSALIASTRTTNAKIPAVLLAAHIDVVTGGEQLFTLREAEGKLFGRGVYDMKFAVAGYMRLVDELRGRLHDYDFAIMITTDEEYGSLNGINGTLRFVEAGYRPRVCILPDSTAPHWEIESLTKGYWRFDLVASGKSAHGSRPWEGESASFKLIQALHELKEHFKDHGPATNTLNIGVIHGGDAYNLIPAQMTAAVEIRLLSHEAHKRYERLVAAICKRHSLTYRTQTYGPPVATDLNHPLMAGFMDSIRAVTGVRPKGFTSLGASDSVYFDKVGIPCAVSSPAGGRHHSDDEWLDRDDFLRFVPILHDYLERVAKVSV